MRKKLLLFCSFFAFFASTAAAEPNPLYEELSRGKEIKVFVKFPGDSGASKLDAQRFKAAVEKALMARKSIRFNVVSTESEARLVIDSDIKGFLFSLTDPLDMLVGVVMAAMDAAKVDHFASAEIRFIVREASGKTRWEEVVHASLTDEKFTEIEAREKILDRAADVFIRSAFGKKK